MQREIYHLLQVIFQNKMPLFFALEVRPVPLQLPLPLLSVAVISCEFPIFIDYITIRNNYNNDSNTKQTHLPLFGLFRFG